MVKIILNIHGKIDIRINIFSSSWPQIMLRHYPLILDGDLSEPRSDRARSLVSMSSNLSLWLSLLTLFSLVSIFSSSFCAVNNLNQPNTQSLHYSSESMSNLLLHKITLPFCHIFTTEWALISKFSNWSSVARQLLTPKCQKNYESMELDLD